MTVNVAIAGAAGRMGRALAEAINADDSLTLTMALEEDGHAAIGAQCPGSADVVPITSHKALANARANARNIPQVLIDFTQPSATLALADLCRARKIGMVIGTTGFNPDQLARLHAAAADIPLLHAQNMSTGVNALYRIAAFAAKTLRAGRLGGGYDIEISEEHHRYKKDAPSGTALRLGQSLAEASGSDFNQDAVFTRHGANAPRGEYDIGYSVARGGDIVGTHRVLFAGSGEQLEIIHRSASRANYAAGALRAAKFIARAPAGLYQDMLALSDKQSGE